MASARSGVGGRILYGALFAVLLPAVLWAWTRATAPAIGLPAYKSMAGGAALALVGALMMSAGMHALWRHGGGLPMNAFPPPRFVRQGIYRYLGQPIYLGAVLLCAGAALGAGSASGLWLVTPTLAAGAAALVLGYERPDLRRRFGAAVRPPVLALPRGTGAPPTAWERAAVYVLVLLPWLVAYQAVQFIGMPPNAVDSRLPFERSWGVLQWTQAPYASGYALVLLTPLVAGTGRALRRFALAGLVATALLTLIYLTVPLVAPPRAFEPTTWLGRMLAAEAAFNHTVAAFPSFHVMWALLAAATWPRRARVAAYVWAAAVAASCVTTGMHSLADVAAAIILFPAVLRYDLVWEGLRRGAERIANSWREWHFGPVRLINHGAWAGLGSGFGLLVAGTLAGADQLAGVLLVGFAALVGAGLWAQWLEGCSVLLRPFGFYGGLLGAIAGIVLASALGFEGWLLLGAFAVAAPWIQALGRLRCLVQGCCHGGPAGAAVGIHYRHPRSRVTQLAGLAGQPLHPTPLYSILGNVVVGVLLARMWHLGAPPTLTAGVYFLLNGMARFVEESYRAEPQTRVIAGLHIYHWMALATVLAGMVVAAIPAPAPPAWAPFSSGLLAAALALALATAMAMGVDFPRSDRRFSRLADVTPLRSGTRPVEPVEPTVGRHG